MGYAVETYADVVAAVARKQEALSLILKELVKQQEKFANKYEIFVEKYSEKINALSSPLRTDSDITDFIHSFEEGDEHFGKIISRHTDIVFDALKDKLSAVEIDSLRANLWDAICSEFTERVNTKWESLHEDTSGGTDDEN